MSEPVYTARTWGVSNGRWYWQTLKDGKAIGRGGDGINYNWARLAGVSSREAAIEQCRLDMEFDRNYGTEEIVLNPEAGRAESEPAITELPPRSPGFYVVTSKAPGPKSDFVGVEDAECIGVGPVCSGAEWRQEGEYWALGPFARVRPECVVIYPRKGVSVSRVKNWLEESFQKPMSEDTGDRRTVTLIGNPLVNADIEVEEP